MEEWRRKKARAFDVQHRSSVIRLRKTEPSRQYLVRKSKLKEEVGAVLPRGVSAFPHRRAHTHTQAC